MSGTLKNNLFGGEDFGVLHKDINKALESVMTSSYIRILIKRLNL